jgi:hypothetical protein
MKTPSGTAFSHQPAPASSYQSDADADVRFLRRRVRPARSPPPPNASGKNRDSRPDGNRRLRRPSIAGPSWQLNRTGAFDVCSYSCRLCTGRTFPVTLANRSGSITTLRSWCFANFSHAPRHNPAICSPRIFLEVLRQMHPPMSPNFCPHLGSKPVVEPTTNTRTATILLELSTAPAPLSPGFDS